MDADQMAREYITAGWATAIITMSEAFMPREVEVILLRMPFGCEVFLPANVKYSGDMPSWKQICESTAFPGNARHVVTVPGDWADGLAAFLRLSDLSPQARQKTSVPSPKDHANILGVILPATREEIRAAFRRQAKAHHPDRLFGACPIELARAQAKMTEVILAYQALAART